LLSPSRSGRSAENHLLPPLPSALKGFDLVGGNMNNVVTMIARKAADMISCRAPPAAADLPELERH
jgi:hypothetical protein